MYIRPQPHPVPSSDPASAPGTSPLLAPLRARPSTSSRYSTFPAGPHALCSCSHLFYTCLISLSHCRRPRGFILQCRPHRAIESCGRVSSQQWEDDWGGKERKISKSKRDRGGGSYWEMDEWLRYWLRCWLSEGHRGEKWEDESARKENVYVSTKEIDVIAS